MARPVKVKEVAKKSNHEVFTNYSELETRLASVSVENNDKAVPARERILQTRVLMYQAYKNNYSKAQIAKAFNTNLHTVTNYISAVEAGIKMAAMVRGNQVTR